MPAWIQQYFEGGELNSVVECLTGGAGLPWCGGPGIGSRPSVTFDESMTPGEKRTGGHVRVSSLKKLPGVLLR